MNKQENKSARNSMLRITFGVLGVFIFILSVYYITAYNYPDEWASEIDSILSLSPTPKNYSIKLPSSSVYRYKLIKVKIDSIDKIASESIVTISIVNKSKNNVTVESNGYFAGIAHPEEKAKVFHGSLGALKAFYEESQPIKIINKDKDDRIEIVIFSDKPIELTKPIRLSIHAWADFL